jgi:predicted HD phosphohydrolase
MKIIGACFTCRKQHDITRNQFGQEVKCECGGYVVTKTGHASIIVDDGKK